MDDHVQAANHLIDWLGKQENYVIHSHIGVPMGTRTGDLDPGLAWYLMQFIKFTPKKFNHLINHESGLLGISETNSDMRKLLKIEDTDERAAEAIEIFCYQIKKWIGSFADVLGGLDVLVFFRRY